ncbi:hypothetical protein CAUPRSCDRAFT_6620 [Caulochytrium protostelioides]|uniref:Cytoplasmic protein n=1 Tax=Caulochytrium protostelioides TaxID=1555241 RepID=A0A4P9WVM7_9FUNG|nr:hypothetical protein CAUPRSCDRAFT_6620 [Caulochytrium protostelioides]
MTESPVGPHDVADATVTLRVIKSFEYRTVRNLVLRHVDLAHTTPAQLVARAKEEIAQGSGWKPYRTCVFDALKLYTHPMGTKTQNLAINLDDTPGCWYSLDEAAPSCLELGMMHETELSLFNRAAYEEFKVNPAMKW